MFASLRFAGDLPVPLVLLLAVGSAIGVLLYYLRETRSLDSPFNFLIPSLRSAAVAMMVIILAGPVWHRSVRVGTLGRVIFAVDVSESMSAVDSRQQESSDEIPRRIDRVSRLLTGTAEQEGWLETLHSTHQIEVIAFSTGRPVMAYQSTLEERDDVIDQGMGILSAEGKSTDIASALNMVQTTALESRESGAQQSAVVLLSDGRNHQGDSAVDLARRLHSTGVLVHAVGIGSHDEPPDVGIVRVDRPGSVSADGMLAGRIVLDQVKLNGKPIQVRIETSQGETVWQKEVLGDAGDHAGDDEPGVVQQSVAFKLDVQGIIAKLQGDSPRGVRRSTVVMNLKAVVHSAGEHTGQAQLAKNNALSFRVAASTRKRKLLILDGSSRWEMRYLRNLFERDPAWSVNTVLFGVGTDSLRLPRGDAKGQYPKRSETMAKYDAVILGEIPADRFDDNDAQILQSFVARGGGLVVIDGKYDRMARLMTDRLPELIPAEPDGDRFIPSKSIVPTRLGLEQPMMNLAHDEEGLAEFWKRLPVPTATASVSSKTGSEVWAEVIDDRGERSPWLVTWLFGGGRVFYFASDQTWRWRYKVADRFHARFWNQVLAAVMQPPYSARDDYVAIGTDKIDYDAGEKPIIRARLQDTAGSPVGDATVDACLFAGNQLVGTVPMSVDDADRGTYIGQASELTSGAYDIRIRASGFDQQALQATTPIWVGDSTTTEWNRISLNENTLTAITDAGGGQYRHESSADEILKQLKPLSSGRIIESDHLVWQSFYWFLAVMALLTTEWYLRKRTGLV